MGKEHKNAGDIGDWGQVDPFQVGDSSRWIQFGGDEASYKGMTPQEKEAYWQQLHGQASKDSKGSLDFGSGFVNQVKARQGGGAASPTAAGPTGPGDPYMQAATPNASTPWGGQQWSQGPDGTWTMSNTLSGPMGQANDSLQAQWAQALQNPLDGNAARDQAIDSAYKQATSRLDPQWDKRSEAMRTQLLNQGLDPTSQAGRSAMQDMGMQRNDAYTSALASAIAQGTSAGDSVFRNNLAAQNNPLQQMQGLRNLSQANPPPTLLNATIAKENAKLGKETALMQQQTDLTNGAMQFAGSGLNYLSSLGK